MSAEAQLQRLDPLSSSRSARLGRIRGSTRHTGSILAYIFLAFYALSVYFLSCGWSVGPSAPPAKS